MAKSDDRASASRRRQRVRLRKIEETVFHMEHLTFLILQEPAYG